MRTIRAFLEKHPALSYFALTFAISWGGVALVIGANPSVDVGTKQGFEQLLPAWSLAMVAGPTIAGLLLTALLRGRRGLRDLLARLLRWRVGARFYAIALLAAPLTFTVVLLALALLSPDFLPGIVTSDGKAPLLLQGIAVGLVAGMFEELGWTGFAVPTLRRRYDLVVTGLIVGVVWSLWHFLVKILAAGAFGLVPFLAVDLLSALLQLTAYRLLMVWVHERTHSLLLAILMHLGLTASTVILAPLTPGRPLASANLVLAIGWWLIIAALAVTARSRSVSRPSRAAL